MRSYIIHRLFPLGADPAAIIQRLDAEPDLTIRRALLLTLGEFGDAALPVAARTALLPKVQTMYRTEADPGLHASAEWLLRKWGHEAWLKASGWWAQLPARQRPAFAHAAEHALADGTTLLASFHPSRQNTQTGRLTRAMWQRVFTRARQLVDASD